MKATRINSNQPPKPQQPPAFAAPPPTESIEDTDVPSFPGYDPEIDRIQRELYKKLQADGHIKAPPPTEGKKKKQKLRTPSMEETVPPHIAEFIKKDLARKNAGQPDDGSVEPTLQVNTQDEEEEEEEEEVQKPKRPLPEPMPVDPLQACYYRKSVPKNIEITEKFMRVELPSSGVFYDPDIFARTFYVHDVKKLYMVTKENNISALLDIIDFCISMDVRKMSIPDFQWIMYWLRLNSFPRTPYTIDWTSRYGNPNQHEITKQNLETRMIEMHKQEWKEWKKKGFAYPTMRDYEAINSCNLSEDDTWLAELAPFLAGDDFQEKIEKLDTIENDVLQDIFYLKKKFDYGVRETIQVLDIQFKVDDAVAWLKARNKQLQVDMEMALKAKNTTRWNQEMYELRFNERELQDIDLKLSRKEAVRPVPQSLFLSMGTHEILSAL